MRILVVGSGGREHALVWRLSQGSDSCNLYAAPGNSGIATIARCLPCAAMDIAGLVAAATEFEIDLTIVGPEAPLAAGIVEAFRACGLRIFGPTAAAAALESSKVYAKRFMRRYGIPTARFEVFATPSEAVNYVRTLDRAVVVKADGLAAGKGVVVADDPVEAERAIVDLMVHKIYGSAGDRVVIEDRLEGKELSVLALVSHGHVVPLPIAQDYKRLHDGGQGPNTGGMGAIAPVRTPEATSKRIVAEILEPTVAAMAGEGRPYTGVLYAGIMVTHDGPFVLEFNCRWGDPEAQVILPLLDGNLAATLREALDAPPPPVSVRDSSAACVVLAARGYPGTLEGGHTIFGLDALPATAKVFYAGAALQNGTVVTAGGRVLNVVGTGPTLDDAVTEAYALVNRIHFAGMHYRKDIGQEHASAPEGEVRARDDLLVSLPLNDGRTSND